MAHGPCALVRSSTCTHRRASQRKATRCRVASNTTPQLTRRADDVEQIRLDSVSSLGELKVAELKAELSKLGIAPGRRRKAELVQVLQDALKTTDDSLSADDSDDTTTSAPSHPGTEMFNAGTEDGQVLQQSSQSIRRPRRINFVDIKSLEEEQQHQQIQSSVHTIPFWWLGTCAAAPTGGAHGASLALRAGNEVWLFDCGDDTQRQLLKVCTGSTATSIKHLKLTRLFCTSLAGSRIYGLPGMICTLSSAKGDSRSETTPVHVYGPEGLAAFLAHMLATSDTYVIVPVLVFEFVPGQVPPEEAEPVCLNERAKLFRVRIPADAYNTAGFTDVKMASPRWMPGKPRQSRRPGGIRARGQDLRQFVRNAGRPPPGDPDAPPQPMHELRWTLVCDMEYTVTVTGVENPEASLSYTVEEPLRGGNLLVEAAEALGVPPGPAYAALKAGESVENSAGAIVHADQVVTPDTPGRRLHVGGLCTNATALQRILPPVDMLLCEVATGDDTYAEAAGLLTARSAAALAAAMHAECLVVWARCALRGGRARACSEAEVGRLEEQLRAAAPEGVAVMMPHSLQLSLLARPS